MVQLVAQLKRLDFIYLFVHVNFLNKKASYGIFVSFIWAGGFVEWQRKLQIIQLSIYFKSSNPTRWEKGANYLLLINCFVKFRTGLITV